MESHLFKSPGAMSSKGVSGHFSSLHWFLSSIQDLAKVLHSPFVDSSVFWGILGFDKSSNFSFESLEKQLFLAGGSWGREELA